MSAEKCATCGGRGSALPDGERCPTCSGTGFAPSPAAWKKCKHGIYEFDHCPTCPPAAGSEPRRWTLHPSAPQTYVFEGRDCGFFSRCALPKEEHIEVVPAAALDEALRDAEQLSETVGEYTDVIADLQRRLDEAVGLMTEFSNYDEDDEPEDGTDPIATDIRKRGDAFLARERGEK